MKRTPAGSPFVMVALVALTMHCSNHIDRCTSTSSCLNGQTCIDGVCRDEATGGGLGGAGGGGGATGGGAGSGGGFATGGGTADAGPADGGCIEDALNCGGCNHVCPAPLHSSAVCRAEKCARTACLPGWFDVDGPATPGCESTCEGHRCTLPDGGVVAFTVAPVHERNAHQVGLPVSAAAQASNAQHVNAAVIFDAPVALDGGVEARNPTLRHRGGLVGRPFH